MLLRTSRIALVGLSALVPLLAQADPSWGAISKTVDLVLVVGAGLLLLLVLAIVLMVLSYQRPQQRGLYYAQLSLLIINALIGLALLSVMQWLAKLVPLPVNPFWGVVLPLGLWLNGVRWARQAPTTGARRGWVSVAVVALGLLLGLLPFLGLSSWLASYNAIPNQVLIGVISVLISAVVTLGSWAVVSWQLRAQLPATVWRPWWLLPLVTAALSAVFTVGNTWLSYAFTEYIHLEPITLLTIAGQTLLITWVLGVLALLVLRPARYAPDAGQPSSWH